MLGNSLEITSTSQADLSRDPSLSASDSRHSFDSIEASSGNDMFSPQNNMFGSMSNHIERQDSIESQRSVPSRSFHATDNNRSNHSSINSRNAESFSPYAYQQERNSNSFVSPSHFNAGSSKDLLEAAESKIEELRAESRIWERNAKKSTLDVEVLRKEMSEQSRSQSTLSMELSASQQECDSLKQEVEHLRNLLEESAKQHDATADLRVQIKDKDRIQKEIEEEIRLVKESNADLNKQLQKTQQSNIELLSILQELEGIIETQKSEIEDLSSGVSKLKESANGGLPATAEILNNSNVERCEVIEPTQDPDEQNPEDIHDMKLQLLQLQETQKDLESSIRVLEKNVEEKNGEIEREQDMRAQALLASDSKWRFQVSAKEEEIRKLEAKLSEAFKDQENKKLEVKNENDTDLAEEINVLRRKLEDLEKDCNELTEENMELLLKLKESKHGLSLPDGLVEPSCDSPNDCSCTCGSEVSRLRDQLKELEYELRNKENAASSVNSQVPCVDFELKCHELEVQMQTYKKKALHLEEELCNFQFQVKEQQAEVHTLKQLIVECELKETKAGDLQLLTNDAKEDVEENNEETQTSKEYTDHTNNQVGGTFDQVIQPDMGKELPEDADIKALKSNNMRKEEEIKALQKQLKMLEDRMASVHHENLLLQEKLGDLEREKNSTSNHVDELKKEIIKLSSNVESHNSARKVLERLSSELEKGKEDLEQQMSDLEKENMQLSERISALEAQLRYLTDEKETCLLDLRHSESQSIKLRDEIRRLEIQIDTQKEDVRQKVQDMQNRWLEAQEECEYLKKANPKLQSTAENLIEECASLQKFNGDLKQRNMELNTRCTVLESQLKDTQGKFIECSEKIEVLEQEFRILVEEVSLKEKSLNSELESLVIDDKEHWEKVMQENISLTDKYMTKVFEVENLQRELVHLIDQISVAHQEQETVTPEAVLEVSLLRADKARIEVSLQELTGKFALSERKLNTLEAEMGAKEEQLTALMKSQEILTSSHENLLVSLENHKSS
ncbi:unnamed protein product, partial [Amaranthus hypochondriacus]